MRMFMAVLTGLIVFAGTGVAITAGLLLFVLTPAAADSQGSFLATYLTPIYIVGMCLSVFLTYLSAREMFKHSDRRAIGSVTIGNILVALLALPLTLAGFFSVWSGVYGAAYVLAVSVVPLAVILSLFGIGARAIESKKLLGWILMGFPGDRGR